MTTIHFSSVSELYYKEFHGIKNNSTLILTRQVYKHIKQTKDDITKVCISLEGYDNEFFTRIITDISVYKRKNLYICTITWNPDKPVWSRFI